MEYEKKFDGVLVREEIRWSVSTRINSMEYQYQKKFNGVSVPKEIQWSISTRINSMEC